jgi:hypothetical protein
MVDSQDMAWKALNVLYDRYFSCAPIPSVAEQRIKGEALGCRTVNAHPSIT